MNNKANFNLLVNLAAAVDDDPSTAFEAISATPSSSRGGAAIALNDLFAYYALPVNATFGRTKKIPASKDKPPQVKHTFIFNSKDDWIAYSESPSNRTPDYLPKLVPVVVDRTPDFTLTATLTKSDFPEHMNHLDYGGWLMSLISAQFLKNKQPIGRAIAIQTKSVKDRNKVTVFLTPQGNHLEVGAALENLNLGSSTLPNLKGKLFIFNNKDDSP